MFVEHDPTDPCFLHGDVSAAIHAFGDEHLLPCRQRRSGHRCSKTSCWFSMQLRLEICKRGCFFENHIASLGVASHIWKEACFYAAKAINGQAGGFTSACVLTHHHKALSSSVSLKHQLIIVHAPVHVRQLYSPDDLSANRNETLFMLRRAHIRSFKQHREDHGYADFLFDCSIVLYHWR